METPSAQMPSNVDIKTSRYKKKKSFKNKCSSTGNEPNAKSSNENILRNDQRVVLKKNTNEIKTNCLMTDIANTKMNFVEELDSQIKLVNQFEKMNLKSILETKVTTINV